ncbi:isoamylase early set domain-containing protein [Nonomuraea dietziae]|uniref:1,4-alpha-glucan branching enzyme n=1 Tax=Nonomuraea dietziae TaxID=65515 RepID=A0A7W5Y4R5_9ACTN|nr:isoamylase early set domain-containing protein [Nonomuraea dietziae]MBB3724461.1 1,4-alpha-glucan branching enzyme [Nonomuraea dietziae]
MISRSEPDKQGLVALTFSLPGEVSGPVSVVGDFNDWDPHAHPMTVGQDGRHTVTVQVPQGLSLAFRYLREGGIWFDDPQADQYDERGGIVHIPAVASGEPASAPQPA